MNTNVLAPLSALCAMGIALVVALVDRPPSTVAASSSPWPVAVESGADHIAPGDLAARLLVDPASVLLVDVRPAAEFAGFHLPGAVNLDLVELLGERGESLLADSAGKLVVLCSNGMTHPAQAWVEFARRGRSDVRVLEDGLDGFVREVLTPPSLRGTTTEARAALEEPAFAAAAAAFLGRSVPAAEPAQAGAPLDATARPAATAQSGTAGPPERVEPADQATPAQQAKPATPAHARLATDPPALSKPTVVSAAWVARRGAAIVVVDAREKPEEYAAGHVPGARHVPIKALREERAGVPDELLAPEKLAAVIGRLGIDAETEVVAYGDAKLQDPAHFALALFSLGHRKVAILEGGLPAWKAEGLAISTETPTPTPRTYVPRPVPDFRAVGLEDVKKASTDATARILDVRPADAFRGEVSTEARAGHIPHALNRPYTADVAATDAGPYWRSVDELRREYESMGLTRTDPVIVTCRTGHQAAQTWFTLRHILGYQEVRWYDGSWKEWAARSELPVETGAAGS